MLSRPSADTDLVNPRMPVPFQMSCVRATLGLLVTGMFVGEVGLTVGLRVGFKVIGLFVGTVVVGSLEGVADIDDPDTVK